MKVTASAVKRPVVAITRTLTRGGSQNSIWVRASDTSMGRIDFAQPVLGLNDDPLVPRATQRVGADAFHGHVPAAVGGVGVHSPLRVGVVVSVGHDVEEQPVQLLGVYGLQVEFGGDRSARPGPDEGSQVVDLHRQRFQFRVKVGLDLGPHGRPVETGNVVQINALPNVHVAVHVPPARFTRHHAAGQSFHLAKGVYQLVPVLVLIGWCPDGTRGTSFLSNGSIVAITRMSRSRTSSRRDWAALARYSSISRSGV